MRSLATGGSLHIRTATGAAGAAVGSTAGGASALNEVSNNYLKHQEIMELIAARKACAGGAG